MGKMKEPPSCIEVCDARIHNLKNIDVNNQCISCGR